jgi:hypothetical protein
LAIGQLTKSYFMLNTDILLYEIAGFIEKYILQVLAVTVVFDELQLCFQTYDRKTIDND